MSVTNITILSNKEAKAIRTKLQKANGLLIGAFRALGDEVPEKKARKPRAPKAAKVAKAKAEKPAADAAPKKRGRPAKAAVPATPATPDEI